MGKPPTGVTIRVQGQSQTMRQAFGRLGLGMLIAIALVYLLLVVLFQSWIDPLLILLAVPASLSGVLWTLLATGTTLNVESLMGAIMAIGIAASNSILLVHFANDRRMEDERVTPAEAAVYAGSTRLRPVLMTALAMILGMTPMALGLGEAGQQNAPLARAVIGGLLVSTFATLLIIPCAYALFRTKAPVMGEHDRAVAEADRPEGAPA
jgi:multidrug efflux pump subunit AcrB